jgi:hydroxypyruvate reductase
MGGRNQEFALAAALEIAGTEGVVVLSAGTDGIDGPTAAAGAIVDGATVARGRLKGYDGLEFLARNDSYTYLNATGDLLITGPTDTNVMDIQVMLAG